MENYFDSNIKNVFRLWLKGKIPQRGKFKPIHLHKYINYYFHGIGCSYSYGRKPSLDLDYGPNGITGGFDLNRIIYFWENDKKKYGKCDKNEVEKHFAELVNLNLIFKPKSEPSQHLYYLTSNLLVRELISKNKGIPPQKPTD
jgi:hypothetical protein